MHRKMLGGGLPRGHVSELTGPPSSGRTSLAWTWLGAATRRGEAVALIDTFDRFDPLTATRCGLDLSRLLWVRGQAVTKTAGAIDPAWLPGARAVDGPGTLLERTIDRAIKALNLKSIGDRAITVNEARPREDRPRGGGGYRSGGGGGGRGRW